MSGGDEFADRLSNLDGVRFECEVAGVEKPHHGVRYIALECFGAGRKKKRVVLSPGREEARLMGPEISLKFRIERDIAFVVAEQVELHLKRAGSREIEIVERIAVWRNPGRVGDPMRVLPNRRLRR